MFDHFTLQAPFPRVILHEQAVTEVSVTRRSRCLLSSTLWACHAPVVTQRHLRLGRDFNKFGREDNRVQLRLVCVKSSLRPAHVRPTSCEDFLWQSLSSSNSSSYPD